MPFDILVDKLQDNAKAYRGFMRSVKYIILDENHIFKRLIRSNFEIHKRYTPTEILDCLNAIFKGLGIPQLKGTSQAVRELHYFCNTTRPNQNYYLIQSYSPTLNFEPISKVTDLGMSLRQYFEY